MKIALALLLGIFIGIIVSLTIVKCKIMGDLICTKDMSEPNSGPYMSLSLDKDPHKIASKKYVIFKVSNKVFFDDSQK